jgi:hypothetical protein
MCRWCCCLRTMHFVGKKLFFLVSIKPRYQDKITRVLICISSDFILSQRFSAPYFNNLSKNLFQEHSFKMYSSKTLPTWNWIFVIYYRKNNIPEYWHTMMVQLSIITPIILRICYKNINIPNCHSYRRLCTA